MEALPEPLEGKRRQVEAALRRTVVVRGIQTPDAAFRGRLRVKPGRVLIEYQIAEHGYFWHIPIIERLLSLALAGETSAELREPSPADEEPVQDPEGPSGSEGQPPERSQTQSPIPSAPMPPPAPSAPPPRKS